MQFTLSSTSITILCRSFAMLSSPKTSVHSNVRKTTTARLKAESNCGKTKFADTTTEKEYVISSGLYIVRIYVSCICVTKQIYAQ